MKCAHCGCRTNALHRWNIQLCAERRRKRAPRLCTACDIALNSLVLDFFHVPGAAEKAQAYQEKLL